MAIVEIKPKEDENHCGLVGKDGEKKKRFPHLRLEHDFFPEAKKWEVGKEYHVTLKLKMTGISISRFQNDSEFDIIGADMNAKKAKENPDHN